MFTAYDFINTEISSKHMRLGWKVEARNGMIALRYTMLNFDWNSFSFLGNEGWNMFLESKSYKNLRTRLDNAKRRLSRLYIDAPSISQLKTLSEMNGLKIDIDKIVSRTISKKASMIKEI